MSADDRCIKKDKTVGKYSLLKHAILDNYISISFEEVTIKSRQTKEKILCKEHSKQRHS